MRNIATLFVGLFLLACVTASPSVENDILTDEFVEYINSAQNTWIAAPNPKAVRNFRNGVLKSDRELKSKVFENIRDDLPEEFDAREHWPECADVIGNIRDQGACGGSFATAIAGTISDRICIHSQGQVKVSISTEYLISCCFECSLSPSGCDGGYNILTWDHYLSDGIVTGGEYQSGIGCKPYSFEPCEHYVSSGNRTSCADIDVVTQNCSQTCQDSYDVPYEQDLHFASEIYRVLPYYRADTEQFIMQEIYENGPVQESFLVYSDFLLYQSGVYQRVSEDYEGSHTVRVIGWGVDNGTKYWLVANSWNNDWGEDGYFRILKGVDEVGIEDDGIAGLPLF